MNARIPALFMATTLALVACATDFPGQHPTRIDWDEWGVPHIAAATAAAVFYADGWAQMDAHGNTLLKLYGVSRGRAAEYWGAEYLDSDRLVHTLGHPAWAERMWSAQDPELRGLISAFSEGINAWAEHHPEAVDPTLRAVLPVRPQDINLHSLFVVNTRFIAGRELALSRRWEDRGSNAIAIAPSRSASGNALLLQNPHLPWSGEFLFFEKHLVLPGHNLYGVSLVGLPGLAIGFNDHLGWTHTNNPIDGADLYELALENDGYRYADEVLDFDRSTVDLWVRSGDGRLEAQPLEILRSVHGPVIRAGSERALALRLVGADRHESLLQWWRMATATSFDEFEAALRMAQIPFWNVVYADGAGNIFYLFNGHVPRRSSGDWSYWQGIADGSDPALLWDDVHAYDELPRLLNPATGWLQNANDPPWTSTVPQALDPGGFPPYLSDQGMAFRPQRAAHMLLADESISVDELVAIKHDTLLELAERLLDDLQAAVTSHGDKRAHAASEVLQAWDRRADNDSRGAVLFQAWAHRAMRTASPVFAETWSPARPLDTPDGLADPAAMANVLSDAAAEVMERYGRLDVAWGEVIRLQLGERNLPANGAGSELGAFRVAASRPTDGPTQKVLGGDSWVAVVEFTQPPRARVLLSYGNATQPGSPHNGDQLQLFSEMKLREAWRTMDQLAGRITRTEFLDFSD